MKEKTIQPELIDLLNEIGFPISDEYMLEVALTHRSYINEHPDANADNERLEFLGDAVIGLVVADYLYRTYPDIDEGILTAYRAALVRAETLAEFSKQLTIDKHLRLGYGEDESGGREKMPTLCAAFEAVIGAIYLDGGYENIVPMIERLVEPMMDKILAGELHKDAKSEFQVWAQEVYGITPHYVKICESGPDHAKVFTMQVQIGREVWGSGTGTSKRRAAQQAAAAALKKVATFSI